jgi:DnaD/phage-associated family protein
MTDKFNGFSNGKSHTIPIHAQFFSEVLPLVDDLAELKVILFCYWALRQKQGEYRYLCRHDFADDESLMQGLATIDSETPALLDDALAKAVAHGVLLAVDVELDSQPERLYFVNTDRGRKATEQIKAGNWHPAFDQPIDILPERPNIFTLYEENIGPLTSGIADRLKAAENDYQYQWIVDAINIAIDNNVRRWSYINTILESWKQEGRAYGSDEALKRHRGTDGTDYSSGEYADFIES